MSIDWSAGQVITLTEGDTATLSELNDSQLYGVFLYNTANADNTVTVTITWSDDPGNPPVDVPVEGTTGDQGLAAVRFLSGSDASYISASVGQDQKDAQIKAFICSVEMPTDTAGINNQPLPADGKRHQFERLTRFYCVPAGRWYRTTVASDVNQFISVRFFESYAHVTVVNKIDDPALRIQGIGNAAKMFQVDATEKNSFQTKMEGDGSQQVWINADSVQDSQSASLSLQPL